ncbi:hypothetical protein BJV77DRAFT_1058440 [Russula vinacea]|nr:hypothetical protein BJV77DRAFT_1058440 [Russula vinacea]
MAKSTRSKVKRAFRAKKRTEGVFAAADAARLQRLNSKLRALTSTTTADLGERTARRKSKAWICQMEISTHGPRGSRRERWRASKGMTPRPKSRGMNRQGTVASRHKPGRSHRRR